MNGTSDGTTLESNLQVASGLEPPQKIPFRDMQNADALVANVKNDHSKSCLDTAVELYLVYLLNGGTAELDLTAATGHFAIKWFNPRTGGALQDGSVPSVRGAGSAPIGHWPDDAAAYMGMRAGHSGSRLAPRLFRRQRRVVGDNLSP